MHVELCLNFVWCHIFECPIADHHVHWPSDRGMAREATAHNSWLSVFKNPKFGDESAPFGGEFTWKHWNNERPYLPCQQFAAICWKTNFLPPTSLTHHFTGGVTVTFDVFLPRIGWHLSYHKYEKGSIFWGRVYIICINLKWCCWALFCADVWHRVNVGACELHLISSLYYFDAHCREAHKTRFSMNISITYISEKTQENALAEKWSAIKPIGQFARSPTYYTYICWFYLHYM